MLRFLCLRVPTTLDQPSTRERATVAQGFWSQGTGTQDPGDRTEDQDPGDQDPGDQDPGDQNPGDRKDREFFLLTPPSVGHGKSEPNCGKKRLGLLGVIPGPVARDQVTEVRVADPGVFFETPGSF